MQLTPTGLKNLSNKFLTHENIEMDTNFVQIGHIFLAIMQIMFSPLGGGISPQNHKNVNYLGPVTLMRQFFLTDAE